MKLIANTHRLFAIILSVATVTVAYGSARTANNNLLECLDSLLLNQGKLELKRQYVAEDYERMLAKATSDDERYRINNMLYELYSSHDIDVAMKYTERNMRYAEKSGRQDLIADLKIKKSFLLAASGLLMESADEIADLTGSELPEEQRKAYYAQKIYVYDRMATYMRINPIGTNQYFDRANQYKDSLTAMLSPDDHEYLWYESWRLLGREGKETDAVIKKLRAVVDNSTLTGHDDAKNAYVLGMHYQKRGDIENAMKYVTMSAIADVQLCNRDIASLQRLATMCLERGDVERAHNYIGYCMEAALKYPNRVRATTIAPVQQKINEAYQEKLHEQEHARGILLWAVCVLSALLLCALIFLAFKMRQLRRQRVGLDDANNMLSLRVKELSETKQQLTEVNEKLTSLNTKLKQVNTELKESNYVKEEYVGNVFSLCSHYIKQLDDLRRTINRKAKVKQWDDIREMTEGKSIEKEALKDFYNNFDTIFLHLYPHFVTDFNNLLQPDAQILPKEGELLSTELRIYALVRLGITDSVKIAEFLHCSPQTVYNYRFRIRNKAKLAKTEFVEAVKTLGHVVIE